MSVIWYKLSWRHLCGWNWDVYLSLDDADFFLVWNLQFVVGWMILLNYENTIPIWLTSVIFLSSSFRTGFSSHFFHVFFFEEWKNNYRYTLLTKTLLFRTFFFYHNVSIIAIWVDQIDVFRFLPCHQVTMQYLQIIRAKKLFDIFFLTIIWWCYCTVCEFHYLTK